MSKLMILLSDSPHDSQPVFEALAPDADTRELAIDADSGAVITGRNPVWNVLCFVPRGIQREEIARNGSAVKHLIDFHGSSEVVIGVHSEGTRFGDERALARYLPEDVLKGWPCGRYQSTHPDGVVGEIVAGIKERNPARLIRGYENLFDYLKGNRVPPPQSPMGLPSLVHDVRNEFSPLQRQLEILEAEGWPYDSAAGVAGIYAVGRDDRTKRLRNLGARAAEFPSIRKRLQDALKADSDWKKALDLFRSEPPGMNPQIAPQQRDERVKSYVDWFLEFSTEMQGLLNQEAERSSSTASTSRT